MSIMHCTDVIATSPRLHVVHVVDWMTDLSHLCSSDMNERVIAGVVYYADCHIDVLIPLMLIVFGAIGLVKTVFNCGLFAWK